jgi:phosphoglycerol transferase MdoB-like AlkP superfamily enzyme
VNPLTFASALHQRLLAWGAALLFIVLWYIATQATIYLLFQVQPWPVTYLKDLSAHVLLGALLFGMSRTLPSFMLATGALFTALTVGSAMKLTILGSPVMPDDFAAARNMFMLLGGWQLTGAILMVSLPVVLLAWMIAWRRLWAWLNLGLLGLGVGLTIAFPAHLLRGMDSYFGDTVWNQRGNYEMRGLPIHLLQETARNLSRRVSPPTQVEVRDALTTLGGLSGQDLLRVGGGAARPQRNLHMIILESFWDPKPLRAAKLSADPMDPAFRRLWASSGNSHGLSPVFGGYTANTEFEVLCGFPVTRDNVFFEGGLRRDVPCLPRHLAESGYLTFASHPNAAPFWNRVNAYRRIGFQTYWADRDFVLDDMNREFLSDSSLYRQVLERLGPKLHGPQPIFNYVLTYFGHLDYPLNEQRPHRIKVAKRHETEAAYANMMYYKSRELMAFLGELQRIDPDGLIVLFGDHLPFLGPNFGGYTESRLLASSQGNFTDAMFRTLVRTPLVIIDGQRGPVAIGDLPYYQLPAKLLALLGDERPTLMNLTAQPPKMPRIRPLPGLHIRVDERRVTTCRGLDTDAAKCQKSTTWLNAVETIKADLFSGDQHVLRTAQALLTAAAPAQEQHSVPKNSIREAATTPVAKPAGGHL